MTSTWRGRLRAYGAALMLSAASIGVLPETRPVTPVAIVRSVDRRRAGFDELERLGDSIVTVPLTLSDNHIGIEPHRPASLN